MRLLSVTVILPLLVLGCAGPKPAAQTHEVNVAVNLRLENERDLEPILKALVAAGISCSANRAMSCNEAPLKVPVRDFDRAKAIAQDAIIRGSLTARLYQSPSGTSLLEVWEKGRRTRVEPHRLYNPSATMADFN
jgi:hypothetical protein